MFEIPIPIPAKKQNKLKDFHIFEIYLNLIKCLCCPKIQEKNAKGQLEAIFQIYVSQFLGSKTQKYVCLALKTCIPYSLF